MISITKEVLNKILILERIDDYVIVITLKTSPYPIINMLS